MVPLKRLSNFNHTSCLSVCLCCELWSCKCCCASAVMPDDTTIDHPAQRIKRRPAAYRDQNNYHQKHVTSSWPTKSWYGSGLIKSPEANGLSFSWGWRMTRKAWGEEDIKMKNGPAGSWAVRGNWEVKGKLHLENYRDSRNKLPGQTWIANQRCFTTSSFQPVFSGGHHGETDVMGITSTAQMLVL